MSTRDATETGRQAQTLLGSRLSAEDATTGDLLRHEWPPVQACEGLSTMLREYVALRPEEQFAMLERLRPQPRRHDEFVHRALGEIYSHVFGYRDGVATDQADDELEVNLQAAKIWLEREFLDHGIGPIDTPQFADQCAAADHLDHFAATNPGVLHPLFDYLRDSAPRSHVEAFLLGEVVRNEVVDDEVALLAFGLQGTQKAVVVANLWDECGRGRLDNFHTFWLRRFIRAGAGSWNAFLSRRGANPWFARMTSNTNNMLLTRPAYKQTAYGCFLVFESWVAPHFRALLQAMDRLGMVDADLRMYFEAHVAIDPRHSRELSDGIRLQVPALPARAINELVRGAHLAAAVGRRQYDLWLEHLKGLDA